MAAYDEVIPYVALVDERHPVAMSFFEVLTGMAFAVFADTPVDVVVLEVGVGERLDCTNITDERGRGHRRYSIDHTRLLGNTVEEIAAEKAGIMKRCGRRARPAGFAAAEVLLRYAVEVGATVAREGVEEFGVLSREQAGGQQLVLRGLRRRLCEKRPVPAAVRPAWATRPVRSPRSRPSPG